MGGGAAELGDEDVRMLLREHLVAGLAVEAKRDLVRHRRCRQVDGLVVAEQLGDSPLEQVDGRILAFLLVADVGRRNRFAHAPSGLRLGIGAEIDHSLDCCSATV